MASSSIVQVWSGSVPTERGLSRRHYVPAALGAFCSRLLAAEGLEAAMADTVARLLVRADLHGHHTHGVVQAPAYLADLRAGGMRRSGEPLILKDKGACALWDGQRLPGLWLAERAVEHAIGKARLFGSGSVAIRNSHHIGALSVLLGPAIDVGLLVMITTSDPSTTVVAPHGSARPVLTTNPIAFGIPAGDRPILIDMSTSVTTAAAVAASRKSGTALPGRWLVNDRGEAVSQVEDCGYALLPVGGMDHGYKGTALGLMVEALTSGLTGAGRADPAGGWGGNVHVQIWDPDFFAGTDVLDREMTHLADLCRKATPLPGHPAVRLPGDMAQACRIEAALSGVAVAASVMHDLAEVAARHGLIVPECLEANS